MFAADKICDADNDRAGVSAHVNLSDGDVIDNGEPSENVTVAFNRNISPRFIVAGPETTTTGTRAAEMDNVVTFIDADELRAVSEPLPVVEYVTVN